MIRKISYKRFIRGIGISTAPSLNIYDLLAFNKNMNRDLSIYEKIKSTYYYQKIYWTISSTESLKLIIEFISKKKKEKIRFFFPAYYCNEVLEDIDHLCDLEFYDITDSFNSIKKKLKTQQIDAIIICNYFGGKDEQELVQKIKTIFKGIIIHDYAHSTLTERSILNENEFILMSLYKHFPIRHGACLISNRNLFIRREKNKYKWIIKNKLLFLTKEIFLDFLFILKKIIGEIIPSLRRIEILKNNPFEKYYSKKDLNDYEKNMSIISKTIIKSSICNYKKVSDSNKYSRNLIINLLLYCGIKNSDLISKEYGIEITLRKEYLNIIKVLNESGLPIFRWPTLSKKIEKSDLYQKTINLWEKKLYIICNSSINGKRMIFLKKRLISKLKDSYNFSKITEYEYSNIHYQDDYSSYLQSDSYIKSYTKIHYFYKINYGDKIIGKFAICLKSKYGIKFLIINRVKIKKKEFQLNNIQIERAYSELLEFLKKEFSCKILIILTMEINNLGCFINYKLNKFFKIKTYKTGLLDLNKSLEFLKNNMKGRWRNSLKKGLKQKINTKTYSDKKNLFDIIDLYEKDKKKKKYSGIKTSLLKNWFHNSNNKDLKLIAFNAYKNQEEKDDFLGSIIICINDSTATYLLAVNKNTKGIKNVSNILLWKSIVYSKHYGCKFFDLGGIDEITTPGVALFKNGLNPELHQDGDFFITLI